MDLSFIKSFIYNYDRKKAEIQERGEHFLISVKNFVVKTKLIMDQTLNIFQ